MRDRWKAHREPDPPEAEELESETGLLPRPAAALAAALALGTWMGYLLAGESALPGELLSGSGPGVPLGSIPGLLPGGLLLAICPLFFVLPREAPLFSRRFFAKGSGWRLSALFLVACLAFLRARLSSPDGNHGAYGIRGDQEQTRGETALIGRWQALSRKGSLGRLRNDQDPAVDPGILFALDGAVPPDGGWIAILPGDPAVPLPKGPVAGPRARDGFHARRRVRTDAWFVVQSGQDLQLAKHDGWDGWLGAMLSRASEFLSTQTQRLRDLIRARLELLGARGAPLGLSQALVLGETAAVPRSFEDLTRRTGVRHLLAVSGMHVGLISLLLVAPLGRRFGRGFGVAFLLLFVVVAGARSPVMRAALAACLVLLAPKTRLTTASGEQVSVTPRRIDGASLWCLALVLELLLRPTGLGEIGLQLSFLATAGILIGTRPLGRWLQTCCSKLWIWRRCPSLRPTTLGLVRARAGRVLLSLMGSSCAALLMTTPLTWGTFGEAAPVGLLLTPLALPLVAGTLLLGLMFALLAPLLPAFLLPIGGFVWALGWLGNAFEALLAAADSLPGTPLPLPQRPAWLLALMGLLILTSFARPSLWRPRALAGLVAGVLLVPWSPSPAQFELHVLDSGHGTCAIARGPGLPALIYDAGSRDRAGLYSEALAPLLSQWDVAHPIVVLSHAHRDHMSALPELISRRTPILWGGTLPGELRLPPTLELISLTKGSVRLPLPRQGPITAILHRGSDEGGNEGSVALELKLRDSGPNRWIPTASNFRAEQGGSLFGYKNSTRAQAASLLLMGDAEGLGLKAMLDAEDLPQRVELLLAPHHGSDTDLLARLLSWTQPREIWVTGANRPAIGDELDRRGRAWCCTNAAGALLYCWPRIGKGVHGNPSR